MSTHSDRSYPSRCAGLMPFDPSASITASAMARICRELLPEQMTKKSVKPAAARRSSSTTSVAFLSSAAVNASDTSEGIRLVLRRRSVFAMQPACRRDARRIERAAPGSNRRVKAVLFNVLLHGGGNESDDRLAVHAPAPDGGG